MSITTDELVKRLGEVAKMRQAKAVSEIERANAIHATGGWDVRARQKAELARKHAWALRNQADGLFEAVELLIELSGMEPTKHPEDNHYQEGQPS